MLFQRAQCLHQSTLEIRTDTHNLTGCLHLCCQRSLRTDEFVKWQPRYLYHAIIKCRLKACIGFLRNRIFNLVQCITECNLCRNLRYRVTGRLGSQRRRTAHSRIYLDNTVFKALRMQGKLHVTASGDVELVDNIQRRGTKHLIFLIAQGLGRRYDDTVSGMHTDRIEIFHVTYRDTVSCAVTHYLVFDFLPACDAALYEHLSHTAQTQTIGEDFD